MTVDQIVPATAGGLIIILVGVIGFLVRFSVSAIKTSTEKQLKTYNAELNKLSTRIDNLDNQRRECVQFQTSERRQAIRDLTGIVTELKESLRKFREKWDQVHIENQRKSATIAERVNTAIKALDSIRLEIKNIEARIPLQLDAQFDAITTTIKSYVIEKIDELTIE